MKARDTRLDRRRWLVFGGVAALAFLLYLPTVRYDLVWDDIPQVRDNAQLLRTSPLRVLASGYVLDPRIALQTGTLTYYRPLPILSFQLEKKLHGNNPAGYHLGNVLLHSLAVVLVCAVLGMLFRSAWLAAAGGLLFGLHPALNSVVTFVSNRTYLLAGVFLLLALFALLRGQQRRGGPGRRASPWWPALLGLAFFLALLSLESALLFTVVAAGWLVLRRRTYSRLSVWLTASVLPPVAYLGLRLLVARVPFASAAIGEGLDRPLVMLNSFGQQVLSFFVPFGRNVVYASGGAFERLSGYTFAALLFLALPAVWIVRKFRRGAEGVAVAERVLLGYGLAVLLHLPFAHLLFKGPAGRMLYLAGPGIIITLLTLAGELTRRSERTRPVLAGAAAAVVAGFVVLTLQRNQVWHSDYILFRAIVAQQPGHVQANFNLALAYRNAGKRDSALVYLERTLALDSRYAKAYEARALLYAEAGDYTRAVDDFTRALSYDPTFASAYYNRGLAYSRMMKYDQAKADYDRAIGLATDWAEAYMDRGNISLYRGDARTAVADYSEALRLKPVFADAWANRGCAYLILGDKAQALEDCSEAIRLKPDAAAFYANRAAVYAALGDFTKALADYEKAVRISPELAAAHYGRARCLDLDGRKADAIAAYERFLSLSPSQGAQSDTARDRILSLQKR